MRPEEPGRGLRLEPLQSRARFDRFRLSFDSTRTGTAAPVRVVGEYYQVRSAAAERPAPLIQISPILGGAETDYLDSRIFAGWAAAEGFSSFFLHQESTILAPGKSAADLELLLLDGTRWNIQALDLLCELPQVDRTRLGSFGISLGAIRNVLLIAAEPRLRANVLCLAGGDLPRILRQSREPMVRRYVEGRMAREGKTLEEILDDFRHNLVSDPIRVALYVEPARVLMFLGSIDDKVPYATGLALHRALGEPELHIFPLGHYTGILAAPIAAKLGFAWMKERLR